MNPTQKQFSEPRASNGNSHTSHSSKGTSPLLLFLPLLLLACEASAQLYNLAADWSDVQNPFGVWSLWKSPTALFTINQSDWFFDGSDQRAWADGDGSTDIHVPEWMRVTALDRLILDGAYPENVAAGEIVMHGAEIPRTGVNQTGVVWTSPVSGTAIVSGSVWRVRVSNARLMSWKLLLNGVKLSEGILPDDDIPTRASPFYFRNGSGGASVLTQQVSQGDRLELWIISEDSTSDYVNVDLRVGAFQTRGDCMRSFARGCVEDYQLCTDTPQRCADQLSDCIAQATSDCACSVK